MVVSPDFGFLRSSVTDQVREEASQEDLVRVVCIHTLSSITCTYVSNQSPSLSLGVKMGQFSGKGM